MLTPGHHAPPTTTPRPPGPRPPPGPAHTVDPVGLTALLCFVRVGQFSHVLPPEENLSDFLSDGQKLMSCMRAKCLQALSPPQ